ncbi:MAG: flagellar assembly protein FliW [Acidobacteria bacterium]|nr:flagellar assembly protein FliW [Acidobacteriota bacterium]
MPAMHGAAPAPLDFEFPLGLPAFEHLRRFRLVRQEEFSPLVLLESGERAGLRFVCAPLELLDPQYQLELQPGEAGLLGAGDGLLKLVVLTFPEEGCPTANLLAPVVLNPATGRGLQTVQAGSSYSPCQALRGGGGCS